MTRITQFARPKHRNFNTQVWHFLPFSCAAKHGDDENKKKTRRCETRWKSSSHTWHETYHSLRISNCWCFRKRNAPAAEMVIKLSRMKRKFSRQKRFKCSLKLKNRKCCGGADEKSNKIESFFFASAKPQWRLIEWLENNWLIPFGKFDLPWRWKWQPEKEICKKPTCWWWWTLLWIAVSEQATRSRVVIVLCVHLLN